MIWPFKKKKVTVTRVKGYPCSETDCINYGKVVHTATQWKDGELDLRIGFIPSVCIMCSRFQAKDFYLHKH